MDPNDIWAVPDLNLGGDPDPYITFGAVGAALTDWERFEGHLALIFTALIGLGDEAHAARRAYGTIAAFQGRAGMVRAAAEAYFDEHPDPDLQKDLADLLNTASRASARRNEIAHGVVQPIDPSKTVFTGGRYTLVPAYYATNKRDLRHQARYSYAAVEIQRFARQFDELVEPALALLDRIHARHPQGS